MPSHRAKRGDHAEHRGGEPTEVRAEDHNLTLQQSRVEQRENVVEGEESAQRRDGPRLEVRRLLGGGIHRGRQRRGGGGARARHGRGFPRRFVFGILLAGRVGRVGAVRALRRGHGRGRRRNRLAQSRVSIRGNHPIPRMRIDGLFRDATRERDGFDVAQRREGDGLSRRRRGQRAVRRQNAERVARAGERLVRRGGARESPVVVFASRGDVSRVNRTRRERGLVAPFEGEPYRSEAGSGGSGIGVGVGRRAAIPSRLGLSLDSRTPRRTPPPPSSADARMHSVSPAEHGVQRGSARRAMPGEQ